MATGSDTGAATGVATGAATGGACAATAGAEVLSPEVKSKADESRSVDAFGFF